VGVTILDVGLAQVVVSGTAVVADAPLTPDPSVLKVHGGKPFTGTVATFTDADSGGAAADYTATITWDDGTTSTGTISGNGPFTVTGTHLFAPFTGKHHITVAISDAGGDVASVTDAVTDPTTPDQIYVFAVYQQLIGQPPAYASMIAWAHQIDTGALTREKFVLQVESTPAYRQNLVLALDARYLHESPGTAALAVGTAYLANHSAEQLAERLALPGFVSSVYRDNLLATYTARLSQPAQARALKWALSAWQTGWTDNRVVAHVLASSDYWTLVEDR
jgi:hypothetical protein